MGFHLQLYPPKFWDWTIVLLILLVPGILVAYLSQSLIWLALTPVAVILIALLIAAIPQKRNVSVEEFADELERHLLGTEAKWDWDDVTSVAIADGRLDRIRGNLPKFDTLHQEKDREELKALIEAIRRGEFPEVVPPESLTYR